MAHYVSEGGVGDFSPMNANFGIVPPLGRKIRGGKAVRNEALSERSLELLEQMKEQIKA
jgi:methylenetetrahydrofolate--tRNA-(uracil-5-)-methyltransferase